MHQAEQLQVIQPGQNCRARSHAQHVRVLVDAAEYFHVLRRVFQQARECIYIAGWDVKTHTLLRDQEAPFAATTLIEALNECLQNNPRLHIYVLCWNWTFLFGDDREWWPRLKWWLYGHSRLHFKLDSSHPLGGCYHQKLVVVDDAVAFCGGIDLTTDRWDTPLHRGHDPQRCNQNGTSYPPHHDVQMALNGEAARDLGTEFRERWARATGERLRPPGASRPMWPAWLKADFTAVQVALARTIAGETYEIAQMTTRALALARQRIYIENQYLTCRWVVDSLQRRLQQPDGPEVILILSRRYKGHLEKRVFGRLMEQAIRRLRHADHFHRLGVFYLAAGGSDESVLTKVHSKVMIVDDRFLKIGSANLSHRSMTVDTECDLGIEALDQSTTQAAIQNILTRLVAEHCDLSTTAVHEALQTAPGLLAVLNQATQTGQGRLRFFPAVSAAALIKVSRLGQVIADPGLPWSQLLWAPRGAMSRLPANLTMVLLGLLLPPALWLAGGW